MNKQISVYDNTVSARTYVSYIAEQAGGFACIGRDGKLYIRTIGKDTAQMPLRYFENFEFGEKIKISRIKYEDGIQLFEKGDTTGNTIYINQENMYIVDQEQIDNIYNLYKDLEVYSFSGSSFIDPALDIGDIIDIDGKKIIYQGSGQFGGKFKADISSKIQCKAKEETMSRTPSQKAINRRVQSEIDQANGKITQLVEETSEHEQTLVKHEEDINGLKQTVENKIEFKRKECGTGQVKLENCKEDDLYKLNICGAKEYNNYLFPRRRLISTVISFQMMQYRRCINEVYNCCRQTASYKPVRRKTRNND